LRNILASQRGPLPRGWFDIALGWDELRCLAFVEKIATAKTRSWRHVSRFIVAEVDGEPVASLCAFACCGHRTRGACGYRGNRWGNRGAADLPSWHFAASHARFSQSVPAIRASQPQPRLDRGFSL
jgi:hypothetical protein